MLLITSKLRRIKILRFFANLITFPIRLPFILIYLLGQGAMLVNSFIVETYQKFEIFLVNKYKLDEVARKQFEENPQKFKRKN